MSLTYFQKLVSISSASSFGFKAGMPSSAVLILGMRLGLTAKGYSWNAPWEELQAVAGFRKT